MLYNYLITRKILSNSAKFGKKFQKCFPALFFTKRSKFVIILKYVLIFKQLKNIHAPFIVQSQNFWNVGAFPI